MGRRRRPIIFYYYRLVTYCLFSFFAGIRTCTIETFMRRDAKFGYLYNGKHIQIRAI